MSQVLINKESMSAIGDAIRAKNGEDNTYLPSEMAEQINSLLSISESSLHFTGRDCSYLFYNGSWDSILMNYGDYIKLQTVSNAAHMFEYSKVINIPFEININSGTASYIFGHCEQLEKAPYITGRPTSLSYIFQGDNRLATIPEDWAEHFDWSSIHSGSSLGNMFYSCFSLKHIPQNIIDNLYNSVGSASSAYYYTFSQCYTLGKVENLPVSPAVLTIDRMAGCFNDTYRLSKLTFATNADGTPKIAQFKNQNLKLTSSIGYGDVTGAIIGYNSGLTTATQITDQASYEALKDNEDSWTLMKEYSRYNKTSALETINSLPDTSAYGTNTISFNGDSGSLTDGGAINTMTADEIAVAAAKGWTVTIS